VKRIKNNNSGFTLVELIIAMAVLAFLMTAIGSLMGSSIASHKKQKAEIQVHNSAQQTYDQLTDSIMQAKEVVVIGYEVATPYDFAVPGEDVGATPTLVCYVKSEEMKDFIADNPSVYYTDDVASIGASNIRLFSEFDTTKTFYVKQLSIKTSVPLDMTAVPATLIKADTADYYDLRDPMSDGGLEVVRIYKNTTASGLDALSQKDNLFNTYVFEGNCMYYGREYSFMTTNNDSYIPYDKHNWLYNDGLSYVKTTGAGAYDISACTLTVDAENGAIGIELMYNNRNMTYTTQGMVNIRNSYVLKGKDN